MNSFISKVVETLHGTLVSSRRVEMLSQWIARLLCPNASMLDVGCGDGAMSAAVQRRRPDIRIRGVDVLLWDHANIPVEIFDGHNIPFPDGSFNVVLFSDVCTTLPIQAGCSGKHAASLAKPC